MENIPLKGSDRFVRPGAKVLAPADPTELLEVTVLVRRRAGEELRSRAAALASGKSAAAPLSREEFSARHGADPADLAAVRAFAAAHGLAVVLENVARRSVILSGTVAQFNAAFQVQLQQMRHGTCSYRGRTGGIELPSSLTGIVEAGFCLCCPAHGGGHLPVRPPGPAAPPL